MAKIALKDFSREIVENKSLYKLLDGISSLTIDTSICDVVGTSTTVEPIIEIHKAESENSIEVTTFGFVGRFTYKKVEFDITYRFGEHLLDRMIAKVNDFNINTLEYEAKNSKKNKSDSLAMKILYLNFIFKLEKLSILGIPKSYERIEYHDNRYRGQLDINNFIKKDMPYQGKISTVSYEQIYVQEILDVLYGAITIIEKSMFELVSNRLFQIKNLIYHYANRRLVDERTIENAIYHKSIQNSLYADFKQILEISGYIIRYNNQLEYKANNKFSGLIFDVSLVWESYLYKLLKESFEDDEWKVVHEDKLFVYENKFYNRHMYPDIIIKNDNNKKILVFDAKSKSMTFQGKNKFGAGDLNRNDFFQINTYMSYYQNKDYEVIAGGLLYPMEGEFSTDDCHSDAWFGNNKTKFIVDGLELSRLKCESKEDGLEPPSPKCLSIVEIEQKFIKSIKSLITRHNAVQPLLYNGTTNIKEL